METEEQNGMIEYHTPPPQPVGIYGWRKRCLYAFVLTLMVVVIVNLALTVWILRVLHFSLDGIGHLKISPKGFRLDGEAEFLKSVYVYKVKAKEGSPLYVQSNRAVKLLTTDKMNKITSKIMIDNEKITAKCKQFLVEDTSGNEMLSIVNGTVKLGEGDATFSGDIKFMGALATPNVRGPTGQPILIQSSTSSIQIISFADIQVKSKSGNVTLQAADNISFISEGGSVFIKSPKIFLPGLPKTEPYQASAFLSSSSSLSLVSELCLCENGLAFLGRAGDNCRTSGKICSRSTP